MSEKSGTATPSRSVADNPAAQRLKDEAGRYAHAMVGHIAKTATQKVTDVAGHLNDVADGGSLGGEAFKNFASGKNPVSAVGGAVTSKVGDSVKSMFSKGRKSASSKTVNIVEEIDIGVPRSTVYKLWTEYQEFPHITKGVQSAEQTDEDTVEWRAKIFWSTRTWSSTITEEVEDQRIAWTSKGSKGSVDGVVTFHELTPDLTRVLLDLRYHPQGLFEKTGNVWRAQGRRARLDLKKFRQYAMSEEQDSQDGEQADAHDDGDDRSSRRTASSNREAQRKRQPRPRSTRPSSREDDEQGRDRRANSRRRSTRQEQE